jgi:hypothetical protein
MAAGQAMDVSVKATTMPTTLRASCSPEPRRQRHAGALWTQRWQHAQTSLSGAVVVIRLRTSGGAKGDDVPPEGTEDEPCFVPLPSKLCLTRRTRRVCRA